VVSRFVAVVALVTGCVADAPPVVQSRAGAVPLASLHRLVALPTTCGTLEVEVIQQGSVKHLDCEPAMLAAVDQLLRAHLDFAGFTVIDSSSVNADTAEHHEVSERSSTRHPAGGISSSKTERVDRTFATFDDATPLEQKDILMRLRVDALVSSRVWVGADVANGFRNTITAQVRLVTSATRELVWEKRCAVESSWELRHTGVERAMRCAMAGAGR